MRQAYDYWQDQPGIVPCNACAQRHCITHHLLQTTLLKRVSHSFNINPHYISTINCFIAHSMLQHPAADTHNVPCTLLINPTTPSECVLSSPAVLSNRRRAPAQPAPERPAPTPRGGRPLYSNNSGGGWFQGGLTNRSPVTEKSLLE